MSNYWYKNAVIYELYIKGFKDSTSDGQGDIRGIISKLDYLVDLGINCLWLLPMYPSPGKDDGYDIMDYCNINPDYGTLKDFNILVKQAHKRDIRILIELVLNHTSDQHPWFIDAKKGADSKYYNYYVWSDKPDKYKDARIIFTDSETSNWAFCRENGKYYWHRFYSFQPDLNFENPQVREEMKKVVKFWFDKGIDGFRVDAVPYLFEKEGTSCENLSETHQYIKELRIFIDNHYKDKILLAEANQWPEDLLHYFGNGDEFHMAFNFPLMPRIFMALEQEDCTPVIEIMQRLPKIPENCQWAIFLRNHDELSLEMVTDKERDYLFNAYAEDKLMKLNLGIRRRLAPLVDNDQRKIELLYVLLLTLPGTPVIYYGDEIGMGDNIYLGDRMGVRTPMHWNQNKNAGFSDSKPSMIYAPVIIDPEYNYNSNNVEAQMSKPGSIYNFLKRMIKVIKKNPVIGEGNLTFINSSNKKTLVFVREFNNEKVLCVLNLASTSQPVNFNLNYFEKLTPVEMIGNTEFPEINNNYPYTLTLGAYGYYVFYLKKK